MTKETAAPRHRIYLLAIWEEESDDSDSPVQWRFSLEHPASGQRRGFASLAALVTGLQQMTGGQDDLAVEEDQTEPLFFE